ncbi:MAG TPA: MOSC domain-containing protein [Eoetvoesiella sp.]
MPFGPRGELSAIHKMPVTDAAYLDLDGFSVDEQGDTRNHGGAEKAVHHYASEHYAAWQNELRDFSGVTSLGPGGFGENLSTRGLTEDNVAIGDTFILGQAVIQVSQPRQPCWKLNIRFNVRDMAHRVQTLGRTGWYYRVLHPGLVRPNDVLLRTERVNPNWPISRVLYLLYQDRLNIEALTQLASLHALNPKMQSLAARRVKQLSVEDWSSRLQGEI